MGSWRGHHRPVSCVIFDLGDTDGCTLFTGGDDGVVNAWCLQDVVDRDCDRDSSTITSSAVRPFRTWSEHHLPVTSICILPGAGRGSARLVSSSLDRNLIVMELGDGGGAEGGGGVGGGIGRTLARMTLPSGIRAIVTDNSGGRLYCGGADGNVYIVDMCEYAVRESSMSLSSDGGGGGGAYAYASATSIGTGRRGKSVAYDGDLDGPSSHVTELRGHTRAVTCLALLDPSDMASHHRSSNDQDDDDHGLGGLGGGMHTTLLASGSEDGSVRVWDLRARSCVKVLRPWSASSSSSSLEGGGTITAAPTPLTAASLPPVTSIVVVPRSSLTSHGLGLSSAMSSSRAGKRRNADGDSSFSMYKPLKGFLRGTSVIRHGIDDVDDVGPSSLGKGCCAPILWPRRDESFAKYWEKPILTNDRAIASSRKRTKGPSMRDEKDEVKRLREELAESRRVIERWQAVNNQLIAKLKSTSK